MGVWIETYPVWEHSVWERLEVTPYVGVWIETYLQGLLIRHVNVTPYVGVWIETRSMD